MKKKGRRHHHRKGHVRVCVRVNKEGKFSARGKHRKCFHVAKRHFKRAK
jgi:hypothetical protein